MIKLLIKCFVKFGNIATREQDEAMYDNLIRLSQHKSVRMDKEIADLEKQSTLRIAILLAIIFKYGSGGSKDTNRSKAYILKHNYQTNRYALYVLGDLQASADLGCHQAAYALSKTHQSESKCQHYANFALQMQNINSLYDNHQISECADAGHIEAIYDMGLQYYNNNDYENARKYLERANSMGHVKSRRLLANTYDDKKGINMIRSCLGNPNYQATLEDYNTLGNYYLQRGNINEAEKFFTNAADKFGDTSGILDLAKSQIDSIICLKYLKQIADTNTEAKQLLMQESPKYKFCTTHNCIRTASYGKYGTTEPTLCYVHVLKAKELYIHVNLFKKGIEALIKNNPDQKHSIDKLMTAYTTGKITPHEKTTSQNTHSKLLQFFKSRLLKRKNNANTPSNKRQKIDL